MDSGLLIVFYLAGAFILLLIGREIACWYFKINDHLTNQKRIIELLEQLTAPQSPPASQTTDNQSRLQSAPRPHPLSR